MTYIHTFKPRSLYYTLDDNKNVVPCADIQEWSKWYGGDFEKRRVAITKVGWRTVVSTVFLGIDHNFGFIGPPIVFETLVFSGPCDGDMRRYSTWADAVAGHERMVERVRQHQRKVWHASANNPLRWKDWRWSIQVERDGFGVALGFLFVSYGPALQFTIEPDDIEGETT